MKRLPPLLFTLLLLQACSLNHTDALEPHQIITSPQNRWVHWNRETPIDVTQPKIITHPDCPSPSSD